ncbi:hypothetical protein K6Q96_10140 [Grimontia kaedaensis]|uniref:Uncharacterized protein n=1 Tax=Grimontia kaedaensis TaxID=2872157 RepID=A0ABY4WQF8_9GAMM|nr:hypothetical protein [Grimontia kaedaensis]USH01285.1 hypothetical protein K6Q96_10140 [Grimontia kaedaensis]
MKTFRNKSEHAGDIVLDIDGIKVGFNVAAGAEFTIEVPSPNSKVIISSPSSEVNAELVIEAI